MDIHITKTQNLKIKPQNEDTLGFGRYFTNHMFIMDYKKDKGWYDARIEPYHNLSLDPASPVLHYGQEIFEGLKAFRSKQNEILFFRARDNALRLNQSADRMCMPCIDVESQYKAMAALVNIDRDWVPHTPGTSLYLRPTMIACGNELGSHPSDSYMYYIICSATGKYYPTGLTPISISIEEDLVRAAARGGTGAVKTGGNYAASFKGMDEAKKYGCKQVLWLDSNEHKYVEEIGAMNVMFVIGDTLCTPSLNGSILPGITRNSVLQIARDMGIKTEERRICVEELIEASKSGDLKEAFGTGTAAIVAPIGELVYQGQRIAINKGNIGNLTQSFYDNLIGIQRGDITDTHNWITKI